MNKEKILIAGGTGLVGSRLQELIDEDRYDIHILTRKKRQPKRNITYYQWDIDKSYIEPGAVAVDYIINLTGAGIADARWSAERKKILIESRTKSLQLIEESLRQSSHKVKSLVSASAIGYYGNRSDLLLTEEASPGNGFLSECCILWEKAANNAGLQAERSVLLRIGIVLSTKGGALPKILMTSGVRLLNYFGDGSQYYSWIHIDDLCNMFLAAMVGKNYHGVYNAVSPQPMTNKEFTHKISDGLGGGYAVIPAPAFALKLAMGEMSAIVLYSAKVSSTKVEKAGFHYNYPDLPKAIMHLQDKKV